MYSDLITINTLKLSLFFYLFKNKHATYVNYVAVNIDITYLKPKVTYKLMEESKLGADGFYKRAANYWANVPATVNGVLAGYENISNDDVEGSKEFFDRILSSKNPPNTNLALDCGAGIGRVTKNLLVNYFHKVDLVEQDEKFITAAKQYLGEDNDKLGTLYQIGLQHFEPEKRYDVIWCQWVLGYLNDLDFVSFFKRCGRALTKNGIIIVKDNVNYPDGDVEYDDEDSSFTRPYNLMLKLLDEAQLDLIESKIQHGFPDEIFPVYMIALKPRRKYSLT